LKKRGVEGLKKEELVKERLQMWLGLAMLRMGVMVTEMNTRGGPASREASFLAILSKCLLYIILVGVTSQSPNVDFAAGIPILVGTTVL